MRSATCREKLDSVLHFALGEEAYAKHQAFTADLVAFAASVARLHSMSQISHVVTKRLSVDCSAGDLPLRPLPLKKPLLKPAMRRAPMPEKNLPFSGGSL